MIYDSTVIDAKLPPVSEWPKLISDSFKALDKNGDGTLQADEWFGLLGGDTNGELLGYFARQTSTNTGF